MKSDNWTPIGIGLGLALVIVAMVLDGSSPAAILKPAPILLVIGGTFMAATAGFTKTDLKTMGSLLKLAFKVPVYDAQAQITQMCELSALLRSQGALEAERAAKDIADKFVRVGLEQLAGSASSDEVHIHLETELASMKERHNAGARIFRDMGGYAPTLGIIGTVVGLIHVLGSLSSPGALGPAIASAFTATLWGVLSANVVFLPLSKKLIRADELETQYREMQIEGIMALQRGASSRTVRESMEAHVPPAERV
ncbi:MAG TPA: MotA/TolQ/ExbB proton channel family protein, partial [Acidimicrobiales bacterium]|nr:MotA/TolQ/ExbB proton channel family protein [Acidimicrobiales bacterium]